MKKEYVVIADLMYPSETVSRPVDFSELVDETDVAVQSIIGAIGEFSYNERSQGLAVLSSKCGVICPVDIGSRIIDSTNELMSASSIEERNEARKKYEKIINGPGLFSIRYVPLTLKFHFYPDCDFHRTEVLFNGIVDFEKICFELKQLGFDITMTNHGIYFNKEDNTPENTIRTYDNYIYNGIRKYNGTEGIKIRLNPHFNDKFESLLQEREERTR